MKYTEDIKRHLEKTLAHLYLAIHWSDDCIDEEFNPQKESLRERGRVIKVRNQMSAISKQLEDCKKDIQSLTAT